MHYNSFRKHIQFKYFFALVDNLRITCKNKNVTSKSISTHCTLAGPDRTAKLCYIAQEYCRKTNIRLYYVHLMFVRLL